MGQAVRCTIPHFCIFVTYTQCVSPNLEPESALDASFWFEVDCRELLPTPWYCLTNPPILSGAKSNIGGVGDRIWITRHTQNLPDWKPQSKCYPKSLIYSFSLWGHHKKGASHVPHAHRSSTRPRSDFGYTTKFQQNIIIGCQDYQKMQKLKSHR